MRVLTLTRSRAALVLLGTALLFVAAQIQIPLQPVPITLQTLAVITIGLLFDRRTAVQAVLLYLGLGVLGLPVFAGFSNLVMVGSRAGYLVGFLAAVWSMTYLREYFGLLVTCLLGSAVIYACGVAWLSFYLGFHNAVLLGFVPFIVPGIIKAALLSGVVRFLRGAV
ncbi:MAG: biotin transporter BioY [Myxococcaceae bacterium]